MNKIEVDICIARDERVEVAWFRDRWPPHVIKAVTNTKIEALCRIEPTVKDALEEARRQYAEAIQSAEDQDSNSLRRISVRVRREAEPTNITALMEFRSTYELSLRR